MTEEETRVLRAWERFLKGGCQERGFTKALYDHLIQHCEFIAHYDRMGFYRCYFESGEDTVCFLRQFDGRSGALPKSVEYGLTYWLEGEYAEVNKAMIEIATPYIPGLIEGALVAQREADLARARELAAKHGVTF